MHTLSLDLGPRRPRRRSAPKARFFARLAPFSLFALALGCPPPGPVFPPPSGEVVAAVKLERVAQGLTSPVGLAAPNDGSGRLFIVDQIGLIHVLDASGNRLPAPFLDLRGRMQALSPGYDERGLLGLALHPNFAANGRLFVFYNAPLSANGPADFNCDCVISEFRVSTDPNVADAASERELLRIPQPQFNHVGGQLVFGPDGFLYIGVGDGGGAGDVGLGHTAGLGNGQDRSTLRGKILRIDINNGNPYVVPADNPFVNGPNARPEIWAYGFRNPWRFTFDRGAPGTNAGAGRLFVGEVGQALFEEVDLVAAGGNYGWHVREGNTCFNPQSPDQPPAACATTGAAGEPLRAPLIEYGHKDAQGTNVATSVIGGFVYRGTAIPDLRGDYVFGDFSRGFISGDGTLFAARENADGSWTPRELQVAERANQRLGLFLFAFGEDAAGELYVLTSGNIGPAGETGEVYRIVPAP